MTAAADAKLALCVWRVGACLAAFIGWTDGQTPSNSVSVYPLVRWSSYYSDGLARQLCCINLFEYPYNIIDALGIACSLSVGGTTVVSLETMALSLRNHSVSNSSVYGRLATFALNKTMADVQTAFGGTGTSYKKELQLLIRFELITGAEFSSSTLGGVNLGGRQNRQITSVWPNAYAYASIAASATGLPIRCADSSASLTLDDGIKTYLLSNAVLPSVTSITEAGYSTLKTNAASAATDAATAATKATLAATHAATAANYSSSAATDAATAATQATNAATVVGHNSYGNSAIQTVLRSLTKEVVGIHEAGVDVDGVSDKVDDLLDGYSTLKTNAATAATNASTAATQATNAATDAATAATQATNAASAVANNTYGLSAIKTAVSNVASDASTAASKATQAASYASSADSVVSSVVYGNAVLKSALASVATSASSAATDAASAASAVVSGTYGNAAIKSALDSVATNASTAATQATLGASQATTAASQATNAAGYAYSASLDAASAASAVTSASYGNAALKSAIESACDKADRNWAGIEGEGVDEPSYSGIRAIGQAIEDSSTGNAAIVQAIVGVQTTADQNHALLYGVDNYHDGELVSHTDGVSDKVDDLLDGYSTLKTNANTAATKATSAASQGLLAAARSLAALDIVGHSTYGNQAIYNKSDSVYDLLAGVDDGEDHEPGVVDKLDALTSAVSDLADDVGTDPALVSRISALTQTIEKLRASIALVRKGGVR